MNNAKMFAGPTRRTGGAGRSKWLQYTITTSGSKREAAACDDDTPDEQRPPITKIGGGAVTVLVGVMSPGRNCNCTVRRRARSRDYRRSAFVDTCHQIRAHGDKRRAWRGTLRRNCGLREVFNAAGISGPLMAQRLSRQWRSQQDSNLQPSE
jgi:hypothetical protein